MGKNSKVANKKKRINRETKLRLTFDEDARKNFLTGFKKRKDERRKVAQEEMVKKFKDEKKRIQEESKEKMNAESKSTSHRIIPEIAYLIETKQTDTAVKEIGSSSVSITTLDSLDIIKNPWRKKDNESDDSDEENDSPGDESDEEMPGMSLKEKPVDQEGAKGKELICVDPKIRQRLAKQAHRLLKETKVFKATSRLKATKQRKAAMRKGENKRTGKKSSCPLPTPNACARSRLPSSPSRHGAAATFCGTRRRCSRRPSSRQPTSPSTRSCRPRARSSSSCPPPFTSASTTGPTSPRRSTLGWRPPGYPRARPLGHAHATGTKRRTLTCPSSSGACGPPAPKPPRAGGRSTAPVGSS